MNRGAGKIRRSGGAGKRNIHALPTNRPAGRLSTGCGLARVSRAGDTFSAAMSGSSTSSMSVEESFSLVTENPLNFSMAIRLTPDLVEEIKRAEANNSTARIKFDGNGNYSDGNVINVGDKNFKFTWSREMGGLCDIYEERESGEDGNGLLVESGGAWRKLSVQRVLDETTKNHVKMRSEEAERKLKSRKAIVLDHQNPSTKNQMKALVAVAESNVRRTLSRHKKEPPLKKLKSDPFPVGPPKSIQRSGSATSPLKCTPSSALPLPLQQGQNGTSASPIGTGNLVKGNISVQDVIPPTQYMNKTADSDKETPNRMPKRASLDKRKQSRKTEAKPDDLRIFMISLLKDSKGMTRKALEKAIGDSMPYSVRLIEPILKQIATFQAPGRYFLKPEVEIESFKKPLFGSESSPDITEPPPPGPRFSTRTAESGSEEHAPLNFMPENSLSHREKNDNLPNSPDNFSNKNVLDNNGIQAASISSDSRKNDSESDGDIMTSDDDKECTHILRDSEYLSHKSRTNTKIRETSGRSRDSSSDENSRSFEKYEKEEAELKNPITGPTQYKEYVTEYQEKYESYCSLNKILESYRNEFRKLGKDLEAYRGRDMMIYHGILAQMKSSFYRCGERHKRLTKIFIVLYEELMHLKQMIIDYASSCRKD